VNSNLTSLLYSDSITRNEFASILAECNTHTKYNHFCDLIWEAVELQKLTPLPLPFIAGDHNRKFNLNTLVQWAISKGFNLPAQLHSKKNSDDPYLKYSTPLLELQRKAIEKFWLNHNSNSLVPKHDEIISWIKQEGQGIGISDREATAIDLIIRPSQHKKGGNKKTKG
jgi:hypothetical protein